MTAEKTLPYGAWPSPITAVDVARGFRRLGGARIVGDEVWWLEGRSTEGGRQVITRPGEDGGVRDVTPMPWNVRSRVHEYGGSAWLAVPVGDDHAVVFVNFADQRLYRLDPDGSVGPLTPEVDARYAEPILGPGEKVWCIRESHADGRVTRDLVAVPLDGSAAADPAKIRHLVGGSDFLAYPRRSPDGRRLAWIAWDHPRMPWDGTELRVADIDASGTVGEARTLLGGPEESVLQPEWTGNEDLYVISDSSGWWNLYRVGISGSVPEPLCPRDEEFGGPLWTLGSTWYGQLDDGRLVVLHRTDEDRLALLEPATGTLTDLDLPYTAFGGLSTDGRTVASVAASPTSAPAVVRIDVDSGSVLTLRLADESGLDPAYLPLPESITVPGVGGRDVHAHVYPPTNPDVVASAGELPPYIVVVHGGPTAQSDATLSAGTAYFTSRGIGVIDVNYGGSTGYGREYRERLRGQWGVVDVEDAVSAVQSLVARGRADGRRLAIRGGSAGGWTTLAALTRTDVFSAGASYYGVAELLRFVEDTHDFESRYIDGLIGPLPEARELYVERAPLSHVDGVNCPVLLLQGSEDKIVPPSQAEMFRDALIRKGIPYAYLLFEGEQHGFRKAENQITSLEAELSFYGQVFGFDPPGVERLALENAG
ncbi:MAG TPA: prolyl oligopeptidase family serine peptidase [Mycobacteriales bacterium]|nr:prolyl oligopeptidase family serine peptidase [Mycobacteriales bacterium]